RHRSLERRAERDRDRYDPGHDLQFKLLQQRVMQLLARYQPLRDQYFADRFAALSLLDERRLDLRAIGRALLNENFSDSRDAIRDDHHVQPFQINLRYRADCSPSSRNEI